MISRQSRLRERRKAEGGVRVDVMLNKDGLWALDALHAKYPGNTHSSLIELILLLKALE